MSELDLEQVGLFVNKRFPFAELAEIRHGHITLDQIKPYVGADAFDAYFKFAFVRNPFDRFVSYCAFMTRANGAFLQDPRGVMRHILFEARPLQHVLFVPQHTFVTDSTGVMLADSIGRVEDMQASFDLICGRLGINPTPLAQVNSSKRGAYRDYYDDELVEGVSELYRRDLDLFGYAF